MGNNRMTPHETQEVLSLIAALWPRHPISERAIDAWAVALTPIDPQIAKRAIIEHSRGTDGQWPPTVATIAAAMRAAQRDTTPTDQMIAGIHASAESAARDNDNHRRRVIRLNALTDDQRAALIAEAKQQLHAETRSPVIPTRLAENRAADLLDQKEPF